MLSSSFVLQTMFVLHTMLSSSWVLQTMLVLHTMLAVLTPQTIGLPRVVASAPHVVVSAHALLPGSGMPPPTRWLPQLKAWLHAMRSLSITSLGWGMPPFGASKNLA